MTQDQVDSFKANGFLVLPGFVPDDVLAQWREQFWGHLGCTIDEPDKWPDEYPAKVEGFKPDPMFGDMPDLQAIAEQVGGGHFKGGGCGVAVRWPQTDADWTMPDSGHLDGYPGEGCQAVLMVGATTYVHDVEPEGGCYVYWPASHHLAHRYFRQHPDRIEGTFRETPEWEARGWGIFSDDGPEPAREFVPQWGGNASNLARYGEEVLIYLHSLPADKRSMFGPDCYSNVCREARSDSWAWSS